MSIIQRIIYIVLIYDVYVSTLLLSSENICDLSPHNIVKSLAKTFSLLLGTISNTYMKNFDDLFS